jgi:hypothetical protein
MNRDRSSQGFVLVGVVMLVLALTILGLSLFSLSSYEAQFLRQTRDSEQSFVSALGGLERAKYLLDATDNLGSVKASMPGIENVTAAVAIQDPFGGGPDSTGAVDWDGANILIQVRTSYRGQQRIVQAVFDPKKGESPYRNLISSAGNMILETVAGIPPPDRARTVFLSGPIYQNDSLTTWRSPDSLANTSANLPPLTPSAGVPTPDVASFIASHPATIVAENAVQDLIAPANDLAFFVTQGPEDNGYRVHSHTTQVNVQGYAVWMIDRGVRFENLVRVRKSGTGVAVLVIVAGTKFPRSTFPQSIENGNGIFFFAGLDSNIPVILVSDGGILIEHEPSATSDSPCTAGITIFGGFVDLLGPAPGNQMTLVHTSASNAAADWLQARQALPNSGAALLFISGSWRELTP